MISYNNTLMLTNHYTIQQTELIICSSSKCFDKGDKSTDHILSMKLLTPRMVISCYQQFSIDEEFQDNLPAVTIVRPCDSYRGPYQARVVFPYTYFQEDEHNLHFNHCSVSHPISSQTHHQVQCRYYSHHITFNIVTFLPIPYQYLINTVDHQTGLFHKNNMATLPDINVLVTSCPFKP